MSEQTNRPADPAVIDAAAGRVISKPNQSRPAARRRGRPRHPRGPPADDDGSDDVDCYSIRTFCHRHGFSTSFFHKLRKGGIGPAVVKIGNRTLITVESARRWRRERERASE
jgi:hypothetical protein